MQEVVDILYKYGKKKAEGEATRLQKMAEALTSPEYVAFATYAKVEMDRIKAVYSADEEITRLTAAKKDIAAEIERVKKQKYPAEYSREQLVKELRKALISLIVKGEIKQVAGVSIDSPATALGILMKRD